MLLNPTTGSNQEKGAEHRRYSFGEFALDIDRGALLRNGEDVPLRPKSFEVLRQLVEHAGVLLSKRDLLAAVWPDVIVTDDSLTQCLIDIRKALGDTSKEIVRTVPRRGYLFDIPVEAQEPSEGATHSPAPAEQERTRHPSRWSMGAFAVLTIAIAATWWSIGQRSPPQAMPQEMPQEMPVAAPENSIAVLPFEDMSPAGDQEYFTDGLSEELLNVLAQVPELTVIARTSSFSFKEQNLDIRTIAEKLGVAKILEGSIRMDGDMIRVTAQLIDASNGAHLWSATYDRQLGSIFAIQDQIAAEVADILKVKLLNPSGGLAEDHSSEAYQYYLKGQYFHNRRNPGDEERATRNFRQAVAIDPGLANAWVGLAGALSVQTYNGYIPIELGLTLSKEALDRAIVLNPNSAEAHARLAQHFNAKRQPEISQAHMEQALQYGQNKALVWAIAAGRALSELRFEEAVQYQMRAVELDPVGYVNRANLAANLFKSAQYELAYAEWQTALDLNPTVGEKIHLDLARVRILQRNDEQAKTLIANLPEGLERNEAQAMLHWMRGESEAFENLNREMADISGFESAAALAKVHAFSGNTDESLRWLRLAADQATEHYHYWGTLQRLKILWTSPFFLDMRDDPRWVQMYDDAKSRAAF